MQPGGFADIDTKTPSGARVYDYMLGGKNHFAADREIAGKAWAAMPTGRTAARENRSFPGRVVRYLAAGQGISQFPGIGTGLPATGNVHEVAQRAAPESRVVYVDNDRQAVIASGITDDEDRARAHVEHVLTTEPDRARWGMAALGGINQVICLRRDGGLAWQPMFPGAGLEHSHARTAPK